jgi:hypothetical protein
MKIYRFFTPALILVLSYISVKGSEAKSHPERTSCPDQKAYCIKDDHSVENLDSSHHMDSSGNTRKSNKVQTLSGNNSHSGGYGAITLKGSKFKDASIMMIGLRGAWVINSSFAIGIDLNGVIPTTKFHDVDPGGRHEGILLGGYGGLFLEPIIWSNKIVHLTIPLSMGAGWLGYVEDWEDEMYYYSGDLLDDDVFWYLEPGINAEVNITNYFRINVGISKRFTQDLNLYNTSSDAFDKLNYSLTLKFGGF